MLTLPRAHRRRLRATKPIEWAVQQETKRRTVKVRIIPNEPVLERLAAAALAESDEDWATTGRRYVSWEGQND